MGDVDGLSSEQRALWFLHELAGDHAADHVAGALRWAGALDGEALHRALVHVVRRHAILRTAFHCVDTEPVAVVDPSARLDFEDDDRAWASEAELAAHLAAEASRAFDLARGPLLRARIFRLGADRVVLVVFHRIVGDARSLTILARELGLAYAAETGAPAAAIPPAARTYADHVRAQAQLLASPEGEQLGAYWQARLAGELPPINLPIDRVRPRNQRVRGATVHGRIAERVAAGLDRIAQAAGATRDAALLAAFDILLQRYARSSDLVIGYATVGRRDDAWRDTLGYFENMLPIRLQHTGAETFGELLAAVQRAVADGMAHAAFPFPAIVDRLQITRAASRTPLFQIAYVPARDPDGLAAFAIAARGDARAGDAELPVASTNATARYDLTLSAALPEPGGTRLALAYDADRFDVETIARMMAQLERLLAAIVDDPAARVRDLPMSPDAELHACTIGWNQTREAYPHEACIHDLFAAQAARAPDHVAVVADGASLTYRELDHAANTVAHGLRDRGIASDVMIGVCADRSIAMLVAVLGILKAGAGYLPLDPAYPATRLHYMLHDSKSPLVLAQAHLLARLRAEHPDTEVLDIDALLRAPGEPRPPAPAARPDSVAYVIYTSGSTGAPKGVMVPHRAVVAVMSWAARNFAMQPSDRMVQSRSLGFDVSVWEIAGALFSGATLVLSRDNDPSSLARIMYDERITLGAFVPSELEVLVADPRFAKCELRVAGTGSEALTPALCDRVLATKRLDLSNNYAPTEATITSTYWPCTPGWNRLSVPIGRPIGNVSVYVLDERLRPVAAGVPGELYIGGLGLARGYLGRPGLTADKFLPDPFSDRAGARMYKTGDLARWILDGAIDFLGRADDQVKIRGFRIELGEVEAVCAAHPSVRKVAVIVTGGGAMERRLVAYVVMGSDAPAATSTRELRAFMRERLPEHMVPSAFVVLDDIPTNPNGKVDRRKLPAPDRAMLGRAYVAPRNAIEEHIASAFAEVLRVDRVGIEDQFFELGGTSLGALQLRGAIEARLRVTVPVTLVFRAPTVEDLARELDELPIGPPSNLALLRRNGSRTPLVCLHPIGGTVFCYQELIARLAPDRPCFGLEAKGLENDEAPADTLEAMAAGYARTLVEARGPGPFHLVGWSFGGLLALELARVLGPSAIASIVLIDTFVPAAYTRRDDDYSRTLHLFAYHLQIDAPADELRALAPDAAIARVVELGHRARRIPLHLGAEHLARRFGVYAAMMRASARYTPPPAVTSRAVFIRATEKMDDGGVLFDSADGWPPELWSGFEVKTLPGSHGSLVEAPFVDELARVIDEIIA